MAQDYDVVVIGSGPGGYVAAIRASQLGLKAAIVEKDKNLGGTCTLRGCIPTKALLESAGVYESALGAKTFGVKTDDVELEFDNVQKYRDGIVKSSTKGVSFLMKKNKVDVLQGHGRIDGKGKVSVTDDKGKSKSYGAKNIILATGSVCKDLPFIKMDHKRTVNSDDILEMSKVPESLIVMGAGAVGTEFASIYRSFGSDVTLVEYQDRLLPIEDKDISAELKKSFKRRKIKVKTGTAIREVKTTKKGVKVHMEPAAGGETTVQEADMLLVAVGRAPVTEDVGLDTVGISADDNGFIQADEFCRTSADNVFAIGDIIATPLLAHTASHEGTMVAEYIAGKNPRPIQYDFNPNCTYCSPEVASVGLTEAEAKERGYDVKTGSFSLSANGKARIMGEASGLVKIVADKKYDQLLGAHIIGPKATELIAELAAALTLESTTEELVHTIHPHPTLAEAIGEAAAAVFNGAPINS